MRPCWDCHWKQRVADNAKMSTCRTRHVGAVLTRQNRVVADGFNGNLPGHPHCDQGGCERCNSTGVQSGVGLERCLCVHAETNVISYAAAEGVSIAGTTLWLPCTPCIDCFKLVASSRVAEIVYADPYPAAEEVVRELAKLSNISIRGYQCKC